MFILNNSNLIKDRNIIYCYSFQKVHKYVLIQNELVSTVTFKNNIKLY